MILEASGTARDRYNESDRNRAKQRGRDSERVHTNTEDLAETAKEI